jgi:hypothetical protein
MKGQVNIYTFFSVLFIAPVTPELQCDPNPTAVTSNIEISFMRRGTRGVWFVLVASWLAGPTSVVIVLVRPFS